MRSDAIGTHAVTDRTGQVDSTFRSDALELAGAGNSSRASGRAMHLVQLLLPLSDNAGRRFDGAAYGRVRTELSERFGGITSFTRAPAQGMWKEGGHTAHDDIVVFEVMAREIDRGWWENYRADLERRFQQETIVIRALKVEML